MVTFFLLIKKFIQAEKQLLYLQQMSRINRDEISALNRDLSAFDPGTEFIDPHHDYSYDLDLFGIGSMFQFLNRTVTRQGKNQLATLLKQSKRSSEEIRSRQEGIQELADEFGWRQNFMAKGMGIEGTKDSYNESIDQTINLKSVHFLTYLLKLLPALTLILIGLSIAGIDPYSFYRFAIFAQWITIGLYFKTILKFHQKFESQGKLLSRYTEMLKQIESFNFKSSYIVSLKEQLSHHGKTASTITSELQKILDQFDYSKNILVGFVLDSIFLWDIGCLVKLNKWQQNHAGVLPHWFEVIAEMDALVSLANCNYNHPAWVTPEVSPSEFAFNAENMGHPLIDETRCVSNSFQILDKEKIVIITGANMAGKSTFLRTIGVNLTLASNGCKVCARGFNFSPIRIYTSMRTSDNLMNDESYFYAELLRLQSMLTLLRNSENLFVILDEMLKGTNSVDKLNGSKELINQLIALNTHGIVATHDLGLTELAQTIPSIKNQCFEVQLNNDELNFDYKLTNGVTRTMNATFLMKKMGIIPA
jgi:DNA mismatch repair ATPase MutS